MTTVRVEITGGLAVVEPAAALSFPLRWLAPDATTQAAHLGICAGHRRQRGVACRIVRTYVRCDRRRMSAPARRSGALDPALAGRSRDEQLAELRGRIARVDCRIGAGARARVRAADVLEVPGALGDVLPDGGLARGTTVRCGRGSVLTGLLAAVTGGGRSAAVVGGTSLGLLAAHEMGAQLDRLALVDPTRGDPGEVASVLLDGLDLVVLDVDDIVVPPSRWKVITARARASGSVLIVSGRHVRTPGTNLDLSAHPIGYTGLGRGHGRVRAVHLEVTVTDRAGQPRRSHLTLAAAGDGSVRWEPYAAPAQAVHPRFSRTG